MTEAAVKSGVIKNLNSNLNDTLTLWGPIAIGLIALYLPTYYALSQGIWKLGDQEHGPIVLMVVLFLFWQKREYLLNINVSKGHPVIGGLLLIFGLICYFVGRSQDIAILDIGSQMLVFGGILLATRGTSALKAMLFPLFFIIFLLPLPLDSITLPMKMAVSNVTETILLWFDYPIARSGVVLQIRHYQLLVADACAGMHTLISLEALGLLYLNLVKHNSTFRNITLAILIVPISFISNVIRVIVLVLITYYFGDEVGQSFVHDFAGILLFVMALTLTFSADSLIQKYLNHKQAVK